MRIQPNLLLSLVALLSLGGCVSSGRYDDLKKQYDRAQAQVADSRTQIGSLEQELAQLQQESKRLAGEIEKNRGAISELETQRASNAKLLSEQEEAGRRLTKNADDLKRALIALAQRKAEADRRVAEYRSLIARFKGLIDAGTLRVRIVDGRMVLALPSDVLFDSGSARLSKVGKQAVQEVGGVLAGLNERRFQIEGHTDNVPIHTEQFVSNWELASARALVVIRAMVGSGMQNDTLSAASYAEFHPAATNDTPQGRAENRRIEIVLLPDLSSLPGFDELQRAVAEQ